MGSAYGIEGRAGVFLVLKGQLITLADDDTLAKYMGIGVDGGFPALTGMVIPLD